MMQQVWQVRSTEGARAFALALIVASLVALGGVAGYEIGTSGVAAHAAAAQPANGGTEAPPVTGLQP